MLLGVISDTHGQIELTRQAVQVMKARRVETVIHCGDVGGSPIVCLFDGLAAHFVAGNSDSLASLRSAVESAGQTFHGRMGELEIGGRKIAFVHGDDPLAFQRLLTEGRWDVVAYGHTHRPGSQWMGQTLVVNPGALVRCQFPSIALIQLPELVVTPVTLPWP
ncbi:MAG: YfcE family phosphodiesterase [Thermoguttaceae bacterium]